MDAPQLQLRTSEVEALYETHPYPPVGYLGGLFQRIRWEERQTLNYRALFAAAWGSDSEAAKCPRILVAGCGTFEPLVVALANPNAEIVGVDLSAKSLSLLRRQARIRGLSGRINCIQADLQNLPPSLGQFDLIVATGVIHHLPDPAAGLRALVARSSEKAVFRFMIYSHWGRALLYGAKELAGELGVRTPGEFRKMIDSLPAAHPYKIYFHLYRDATTDIGLADGFLHPCDRAYSARGLRDLLSEANLTAAFFLHGPEAQPEAAALVAPLPASAGDWDKLALLEAFGELQENFRFVARRAGWAESGPVTTHLWNEALPPRGRFYSQRLGKEISFDRSVSPALFSPQRIAELTRGLFLVPRAEL